MMLTLTFLGGLALLLLGADLLVRGASRLALALGLTPIVVGLTVVSIGTSAPELAISVGGALAGTPDLALGNIVGSNIANVLLILGLVALVTPLVVHRQLVWLDVPLMIGASLLVFAMAVDGRIARWEGGVLVAAAIAYILFLVRMARRHPEQVPEDPHLGDGDGDAEARPGTLRQLLLMAAGLALLVAGARLLVQAATAIAGALGLSDLVIGLTVVAVGTSLPEIATSLPVMTAVAVACLPIFFVGHCIRRWEGALFVGYYLAYTAYLLMAASSHDALDDFRLVMQTVVMPLTLVTLAVVTWRHLRARAAPPTNTADGSP